MIASSETLANSLCDALMFWGNVGIFGVGLGFWVGSEGFDVRAFWVGCFDLNFLGVSIFGSFGPSFLGCFGVLTLGSFGISVLGCSGVPTSGFFGVSFLRRLGCGMPM